MDHGRGPSRWRGGRGSIAGRVLSPGCRILSRGMAVNFPPVRAIRPPTAGVWSNWHVAETSRKDVAPPTSPKAPIMYMVDLTGVQPTVDVLEAYLLPLAQDMKLGRYGQSSLVVSTQSPSVSRFVELLASHYDLPIYLAQSTSPMELSSAHPAGQLTATEEETLNAVMAQGGGVSAGELARQMEPPLRHTAALNRLVSLAARGYLHRETLPGRTPDLFIDPRVPALEESVKNVLAAAKASLSAKDYERTERLLRRTLEAASTPEPESY